MTAQNLNGDGKHDVVLT